MKNKSCIRIETNTKQIDNCKLTITKLENSFELLSNALSLAGNKVRLKLLYLLSQEQELCVCDLSDILGMNISAISQHLRKLKDRNIVKSNRKGQTIFYALTKEYKIIFFPFFQLIDENNILATISTQN